MYHSGGSLEGQKLEFNVEGRVLTHGVSQANKNSISSWAGYDYAKDLAAFCPYLTYLSEAKFYINVLFFSVEDISNQDNFETELLILLTSLIQIYSKTGNKRSKKFVKCESLMRKGVRASLKL